MEITYCDGLLSGGRSPALWFVKAGRIYVFRGSTIPGVCVVLGEDYTKDGKWSRTTYRLTLGDGVRHVVLSAPLHGRTWPQATWGEGLEWLQGQVGGVLPDSFRAAIEEHYPKVAARWTATEEALADLDSPESGESEVHTWTYGRGPRRAPYWARPLFVGPEGADPVGVDLPWEDPTGEGIPRIKAGLRVPLDGDHEAHIVDMRYVSGHRGGTYTLQVALPKGWTLGQWVPEEEDE